jgi:hypothetical protein
MAPITLALNKMEFAGSRGTPVKDFFRKMEDKLLLVPKKPTEGYPNEFKYHLENLKESAFEIKRNIVMSAEVATMDYRGKNFDLIEGLHGLTTREIVDPDRSIPKRIAFGIGARVLGILPSAYFMFMPQLFGVVLAATYSIGLGINKLRQLRTELKIAKVEEQKVEPK